MKKMRLAPDMMLFITAAIWGSGFVATEYAIQAQMSPMMILAVRFVVGASILLIVNIRKLKFITKKEWSRGSIAGLIFFVAFYFQTAGQSMTTVANTAFITAIYVILVPFVVWAFRKKKPKLKILLLAGMTFIGVVVLTVSPNHIDTFNMGDFYILICAILFAVHIGYLEIAVADSSPMAITFIQLSVAAILGIIMVVILGEKFEGINYSLGIPATLYLGIFSTCLAFLLQLKGQKEVGASKAGIILSTESFFGTILAILLGIEYLTLKVVVGGILILTAVMLTEVNISTFIKCELP